MNSNKKRRNENNDLKSRIIARQTEEIESLKKTVVELQEECLKKDELIKSIEPMRDELSKIIDDLNNKKNEYGILLSKLKESKKIIDKDVFKGRWNLVRFLLK